MSDFIKSIFASPNIFLIQFLFCAIVFILFTFLR